MFWPVVKKGGDLLSTFDAMDNFMDSFLGVDVNTMFGIYRYKDTDGNYIQEIECPGFNKDNLNVEVSDGLVTISGERKNNEGYERKIYKRFYLGVNENVEAKIEDGILYLTIKVPTEKKQKIELK
jgi:HSP20 family molecular chaperone IbpA